MTHVVHVEVKDATRTRKSLVRMPIGAETVEVGTRHPETLENRGSIHTTELSAKGARLVAEALLVAAADMELRSEQADGDGRGTAPGAGDADGSGSGDAAN